MHRSLQITFSRRGLLLAAIGLAALLVGPALAIDRPAASFYTPQQLEAISQSWAARGGVFVDRPAASFYTPQQLQAISQSWAARGGLIAAAASSSAEKDTFDWSDFGIGAGAMLGLLLLLGGLGAAAHYGRRDVIRPRPVS